MLHELAIHHDNGSSNYWSFAKTAEHSLHKEAMDHLGRMTSQPVGIGPSQHPQSAATTGTSSSTRPPTVGPVLRACAAACSGAPAIGQHWRRHAKSGATPPTIAVRYLAPQTWPPRYLAAIRPAGWAQELSFPAPLCVCNEVPVWAVKRVWMLLRPDKRAGGPTAVVRKMLPSFYVVLLMPLLVATSLSLGGPTARPFVPHSIRHGLHTTDLAALKWHHPGIPISPTGRPRGSARTHLSEM